MRKKNSSLKILFFMPNKKNNLNGVSRVGYLLSKIIIHKRNISVNEYFINLNTKRELKKILNIFKYLFIPFFNKKFKNANIIFSTTSRLPILGLDKRIYKIIFIHDLVYKKLPKTMNFFNFLSDCLLVPNAIRRADLILCPSNSTFNDIKENFPKYINKTHIIPLASSLENISDIEKNYNIPKKYLLCVGTIEPRKNYSKILKAYSILSEKIRKEFPLIIVGKKGWGNIDIKKQIKDLKLSNNIFLKQNISDNHLKVLYKKSFCLIYVSLFEGFGLPIIEAHTFRIPTIVSRNSSMPEVEGEGAIYVNPYSERSIYIALRKVILNKKFRKYLSEKAFLNSQKYSWSKSSKKLNNLLTTKLDNYFNQIS